MKTRMNTRWIAACLAALLLTAMTACAPQERYNTQSGAMIGAGAGALAGQAIGRNTAGTLIGVAVGTLVGAIAGNAYDQQAQAARDAYSTNKRVIYHDNQGGSVEAYPEPANQNTDCRKVTKRVWDRGNLVSETVEEICEGGKRTRDY